LGIPGLAPGVSRGGLSCLGIPGLAPGVSENHVEDKMSNHHAYQMYAHVTWHTWKRVGCVDTAAPSDVRSALASAGQATGARGLRNAVLADHVHLVVSFRPDIRLSDFVRLAKS